MAQKTGCKVPRRRFQFTIRDLLGLTVVVAIVCLLVRGFFASSEPRPVESPSEFPRELNQLLEAARHEEIDVEQLKVYCIWEGFYSEWYWQTAASPEVVDLATRLCELSPLDRQSYEYQYFWKNMPAPWRFQRSSDEEEYFATPGCVATEHGIVMMHDKAHKRLYFQSYFDF